MSGRDIEGGGRIAALAAKCVDLSARHALAVVITFAVASIVFAGYTVRNLGINTDTEDMISRELQWRKTFLDYRASFPQLFDTIVVVVEAATPELARNARERLGAALELQTALFDDVYLPGGGEFIRRHALLYLGLDELEQLADEITARQALVARLADDPTLGGLAALLEQAGSNRASPIELPPAFAMALEAAAAGRYAPVAWSTLLGAEADRPARTLLVVKPRLDFSEFQPAGAALDAIRAQAAELNLDAAHGVDVRLTGPAALEHGELDSLKRGSLPIGLLALVMVTTALWIGLRAAWLVLASLITLIVGLLGTAAFATLAVGHLNLISVAFAVLYVGLGIDFAIHFCLRYRELLAAGIGVQHALSTGSRDVGASLVLCALTTSVGFIAFVPTDFVGVSELGVISAAGVFISLLCSLSLLPALLALRPLDPARTAALVLPAPRWSRVGERRPRLVRWLAAALAGIALLSLPYVKFDRDPLDLNDPDLEAVQTFRTLLGDPLSSPLTLSALVDDTAAARLAAQRLNALAVVEHVASLEDFVPSRQRDKLAVLEDLQLSLGPAFGSVARAAPDDARRRAGLAQLASVAATLPDGDAQASFAAAVGQLGASAAGSDAAASGQRLALAEANLFDGLGLVLAELADALAADAVEPGDLPQTLRAQWIGADGRYRVEILPAEDLSDDAAMARFVAAVTAEMPRATGLPLVFVKAGDAVVGAFRQAVISALVLIALLLVLLLRGWRDPLLVLTPVVLAGALTAAVTVWFDLPFNFANVIALPLLLGVGVDNGIHIVHRYRHGHDEARNARGVLVTSTARAVVFSALTTILSFGNLAVSAHVGMASMGRLLTIGMIMTALATLIVLPAMLARGPLR